MISKRTLIKSLLSLGITSAIPTGSIASTIPTLPKHLRMPDEGEPHQQTWMCFASSTDIWSRDQIPEVQKNLHAIAHAIAQYEPVSILVRPEDAIAANQLFKQSADTPHPIRLIQQNIDDLWARDTGPTFVVNPEGKKYAIDFNFNGWGNKQDHYYDQQVAGIIAQLTNTQRLHSRLVLEGGCIEVDGHGSAIMTESCIINDNRNPQKTKQYIEAELSSLLGLNNIIWLKGIKGRDITDGHTDFYARFAGTDTIVVSRENDPDSYDYQITRDNIQQLKQVKNPQGQPYKLVVLDAPERINLRYGIDDFAAGYVGYYLCNQALIMQKFGDPTADLAAKNKLQALFPERTIEQISIDGIASGGGSIHCATQQEPV